MQISILGCGWLGLPLAKELLEKDHVVKGSTTTTDKMNILSREGMIPYLIKILPEGIQGDITSFLSDAEILIINIPPGLRKDPDYDLLERMGRLKYQIEKSAVEKVVMVSSTGVYEDTEEFPNYTESDAPNGSSERSKKLQALEELMKNSESYTTTIVRFSGLFGPGRHPVNFLSGKKNIRDPKAPVNLIHQKDCIGIINGIIKNDVWGEIFNAAYPEHPTKEEYYSRLAKEKDLALPEFEHSSRSNGKVIGTVNIKEKLGYDFEKGLY